MFPHLPAPPPQPPQTPTTTTTHQHQHPSQSLSTQLDDKTDTSEINDSGTDVTSPLNPLLSVQPDKNVTVTLDIAREIISGSDPNESPLSQSRSVGLRGNNRTVTLEVMPDLINLDTDMNSHTNLLGSVFAVADFITKQGEMMPPSVHRDLLPPPLHFRLVPSVVPMGSDDSHHHHHPQPHPSSILTHVTTVTYLTQVPGSGDMTLLEVITNTVTQTSNYLAITHPARVTAKVTPRGAGDDIISGSHSSVVAAHPLLSIL